MATQDTNLDEPIEAEIISGPSSKPESMTPVPPPRKSGLGSFLGFLLGGVAAAAIGFGLARYIPNGWPMPDVSELNAKIAAQQTTIADLQKKIAELPPPVVPDISGDLEALRTEFAAKLAALPAAGPDQTDAIAALQSSLAGFDTRLATLEKQPAGAEGAASSTAIAAFERELQDLRQTLNNQASQGSASSADIQSAVNDAKAQLAAAADEAKQVSAQAQTFARAATNEAALGRVASAVESGGAFAAALDELRSAGATIPDSLTVAAAGGVPTLVDLQRSFPDAARQALDAALRADAGSTWADRAASFLRAQTGARSLTPREGNDPDAILSRAEAALTAGDVPAALTVVAALPDVAKTAMATWVDAATRRQAAVDAVATLAASVRAN